MICAFQFHFLAKSVPLETDRAGDQDPSLRISMQIVPSVSNV